jgi:TRAP-type C4-dicarboxylate transport system permease large subunit
MELGLHPGIIFALAIGLFLGFHLLLRWPLPLTFIAVAVAAALLGDFGIPFRHLVEGAFGFINLVLALFAGAFFGQMMRKSGAADAAATGIVRAVGSQVLPVLALAGLPVFAVGMFVGIAGVAVLSAGVFAVPALRRIGYDDATIAAFIAVMATAGMIAPPMNVPAQLIADGVNMPWTNIARPLLALSLPLAAAALAWFAWLGRHRQTVDLHPPLQGEGKVSFSAAEGSPGWGGTLAVLAGLRGFAPLALILAIWMVVRISDGVVDPASPLILVIGGLAALPLLSRKEFRAVIIDAFTGTPLRLAAVLTGVGVLVQIMTLTGVRGWLVTGAMSLQAPWSYPGILVGMPLLGGALTAMAASDVLGVPAAFSFIGQDMILNVAALSAIASLAEFVPPTSIAAALACYVVGGGTVGEVLRRAWPPMAVLAALAMLMLVFGKELAGVLT